ncbi:arsenate reductase/protein-tyrosine-phosphatase family protein [Roseburia sp. 499]|uniref:arsenate reductase/protein-tyrosine-phosphatase family protein n=1 Tax=Roseburia sp. 499 TaxID=1261634 RepID=UPI000A97F3B8|nr:phosphotyrosine protein phosphatase [Roseburia sp. 499]WVK69685.1 phosphotyrosine protein phosphatase [Roseburia sp. 499]
MKKYKKIIFVCDSGTARAPMAEAIMKEYMIKYPLEIESRGLVVLFPEPLNQKAEAVLISNGINGENQMSRQLEQEDLEPENLIIAMGEAQKQKIIESYELPEGMELEVLTELTGDELEIINPYGGPLQSYGLCYETLNKTIKKLVSLINEGNEEENESEA